MFALTSTRVALAPRIRGVERRKNPVSVSASHGPVNTNRASPIIRSYTVRTRCPIDAASKRIKVVGDLFKLKLTAT